VSGSRAGEILPATRTHSVTHWQQVVTHTALSEVGSGPLVCGRLGLPRAVSLAGSGAPAGSDSDLRCGGGDEAVGAGRRAGRRDGPGPTRTRNIPSPCTTAGGRRAARRRPPHIMGGGSSSRAPARHTGAARKNTKTEAKPMTLQGPVRQGETQHALAAAGGLQPATHRSGDTQNRNHGLTCN